jgi:hypothetical protein
MIITVLFIVFFIQVIDVKTHHDKEEDDRVCYEYWRKFNAPFPSNSETTPVSVEVVKFSSLRCCCCCCHNLCMYERFVAFITTSWH